MLMHKSDPFPAEARVTIDYVDGKIDFEHITPDKGKLWMAHHLIMPTFFGFVLYCWMFITLAFLYVVIAFAFPSWYMHTIPTADQMFHAFRTAFWLILITVLCIPFSYVVAYTPFLLKWYPYFGRFEHKLWNKDKEYIVYALEEPFWMLHHFENAVLEYECKEDFDRYLERIEIRESPSFFYRQKKDVSCHDWVAMFYFSQPPKTGYMKVIAH